jgi:hypothetical protein
VVGDVGFVNPSAAELTTFLADHHPHLLPEGFEPAQPNAASRLVSRILG